MLWDEVVCFLKICNMTDIMLLLLSLFFLLIMMVIKLKLIMMVVMTTFFFSHMINVYEEDEYKSFIIHGVHDDVMLCLRFFRPNETTNLLCSRWAVLLLLLLLYFSIVWCVGWFALKLIKAKKYIFLFNELEE